MGCDFGLGKDWEQLRGPLAKGCTRDHRWKDGSTVFVKKNKIF